MAKAAKYIQLPGTKATADEGEQEVVPPSPAPSGGSDQYAFVEGRGISDVGEIERPSQRPSLRPFHTEQPDNEFRRQATGQIFVKQPHFATAPEAFGATRTERAVTAFPSIRKSVRKTLKKTNSMWDSLGRSTMKMKTHGNLSSVRIKVSRDPHRKDSMNSTLSPESSAMLGTWTTGRPASLTVGTMITNTNNSRTFSRSGEENEEEDTDNEDEDDGLTMQSAVFLLVTAIVGCGVVALPSLMKLGGWIIVPVIGLFISLAFVEVGQVINKSIDLAENKLQGSVPISERKMIKSFEDFGRMAFGESGAYTVRAITTTGFFGTLVVYTILITQNVHTFLEGALSKPYVLLMITPVLLALSMLKDLAAMAKIMPIGVIASLSSCVLICVKSGIDAQLWQDESEDVKQDLHTKWPEELTSIGTILAVFFSAYSVMGTVPSIRGQMKDPSRFIEAFRGALAVVFVVYMCVMGLGYYGYGNYVEDNVVTSMMEPFFAQRKSSDRHDDDSHKQDNLLTSSLIRLVSLGAFMAALVSTYLLIGFALFFACVMGMVQKISETSIICQPMSWSNCALRVTIVFSVAGIGMFMPHFREVMAIMSSICCSCNNVFFPLAFNYKLESKLAELTKSPADGASASSGLDEFRTSSCRRIGHLLILCLAMFCAVLGLKDSTTRLVHELTSESNS